jgi:hypothetical protein
VSKAARGACAIATQWAVNDAATAMLMTRLYDLMTTQRLRPPEALRAAQLRMRDLDAREEQEFLRAHPALARDIGRRRALGEQNRPADRDRRCHRKVQRPRLLGAVRRDRRVNTAAHASRRVAEPPLVVSCVRTCLKGRKSSSTSRLRTSLPSSTLNSRPSSEYARNHNIDRGSYGPRANRARTAFSCPSPSTLDQRQGNSRGRATAHPIRDSV